jgi:hypothetical protein
MAYQKRSETMQKLVDQGAVNLDDQPDIQTVAESDLATVAATESFMNEQVRILVMPTTNPNEPPFVRPNVNGEGVTVLRNTPTWIKRKHLEVIARMKETRISQDLTPNREGEITFDSLRGHTGLAYPFQVLEDKNPKGGAWLANVLAEAA